MHILLLAALFFAPDFTRVTADVETAWIANDARSLRTSIDALQAMYAADPKPRTASALGYAKRRLALLRETPADEKKTLLDDAIAKFEEAVKADPKSGEAHALLASTLG